ncbi:MAG: hypothetical protein SFU85_06030 [Candidatus Methylacidiphilales bacterium]|nr:hypothetical protein [Candidatus Methylacidiphilales bacterium]
MNAPLRTSLFLLGGGLVLLIVLNAFSPFAESETERRARLGKPREVVVISSGWEEVGMQRTSGRLRHFPRQVEAGGATSRCAAESSPITGAGALSIGDRWRLESGRRHRGCLRTDLSSRNSTAGLRGWRE